MWCHIKSPMFSKHWCQTCLSKSGCGQCSIYMGALTVNIAMMLQCCRKKSFVRSFINIWFEIRRLNKYILYGKGMQVTQNVQMKCANEKMTWNIQDTNLSWYVPKAGVDHTIRPRNCYHHLRPLGHHTKCCPSKSI